MDIAANDGKYGWFGVFGKGEGIKFKWMVSKTYTLRWLSHVEKMGERER